jgi:hypothetical protein
MPTAAQNPFGQQDFVGGFIESALSSLPEMVGFEPTPGAVAFRSANPVTGFVSQVLPAIGPYGGMFALSKTARGAAALERGMQGVKATGKALGMNVVDRPVIAGAVKEMLRYSPLEIGRLGVGAVVNPENTGELFADVAVSTAFAGAFGGVGGYLRAGGTGKRALGGSPIDGQQNMFAHPVVDLRAALLPEARTIGDEVTIDAARTALTKAVLNDQPVKGFISKQIVPVIQDIRNGTERTVSQINALLMPNKGVAKERQFDKRKLWEGDPGDSRTLNPGELDPWVKQLGFTTPTELAENVLTARAITLNSDRAAGSLNKMLDDTAYVKVGDDAFMAQSETGATFLLKKVDGPKRKKQPQPVAQRLDETVNPQHPAEEIQEVVLTGEAKRQRDRDFTVADELDREATVLERITARRADDEMVRPPWGDASLERVRELKAQAARKRIEAFQIRKEYLPKEASPPKPALAKGRQKISPQVSATAPTGPFSAGDRIAAILTDRPGAFIKDLEKLNATNKQQWATMRQMFQPVGEKAKHIFNDADDALLATVQPLDVARIARQSRKTWVAETAKAMADRGLAAGGLTGNYTLQKYADHLYDVFAPSMFKERRNSLYARYSGLLQNRLRVVNEQVNEAIFGREALKPGAKGVMGRHFQRQQINGEMSFREAVDQLSEEELDVVVKALVTQTPAKEIKKLAKDGVISENAFRAVERMQTINADFMTRVVLPPLKSMGEKGNFDLLEGYVIPRILLGDWRIPVLTENGGLVYLASGKTRGAAERMAKAIVDEAKDRGVVYTAEKSHLKHAVEMKLDDITDLMEDVGKKIDSDPAAADIVASAMKRIQFMNVKREARLPYQPRTPGSLAHERSGVKATETTYTREEFIKAFEAHIRKMGNFGAIHSFMERWGNEIQTLRGQNQVLYEDVMRRAQQAMGVEGQITRTLNNVLTPFLGAQMGSKAATKIAAATNKTLYAWQLAFVNPTFALLNALSPIQTVLPQLAFVMRAPSMEANKLLHYTPLMNAAGKPIGGGAFLDPVKILWESVRQLRHADEELQHIHVKLRNDNTLHPMLFEEHVGAGASNPQTLKESFKAGGWAQFLIDGSTVMAKKSEEFARIVSANSGYLVGKHQLGLEGDQLYHFVRRFTESTNYLYGQSDRARLITGPVGSMFGLFKNWQMHFMGMMINYAGLAIKHNTFAPLLWQMGTAATLGGIGATPLRHVADGLANWYDETPDSYLWMQENWGKLAADTTFFGPMGGLGISLQASSSIPGTDVRNEMQSFFNSVVLERAKQLGGAVGEAWTYHGATGQNPLTDPNVRDKFLAAASPRAVSRAASVVEGNYVKSMGTGYPQVQDVSFAGRLAHGMGLNAVEIERHQVAARRMFKDQEERKRDTTYHGKAYATALLAEDYDTMDQIIISATARNLDLESVMRSADNYQGREEGDLLSRYKSEQAARYRSAFGQ